MKYTLTIFLTLLICAFCNTAFTKEMNKDSIVRLLDPVSGRFFCSGTVISDKHVLTAAHCVDSFPEMLVQNNKARTHKVLGKAKPTRAPFDFAIVEGNFTDFKKASIIINPKDIVSKLRNNLITCGYPMGGALFCNEFKYTENYIFMFAGHAFLWPGMSGGPVFDEDTGEIIAVNTAVTGPLALITPIVELWEVLGIEP